MRETGARRTATDASSPAPSFALITPSHRGDHARCAMLVESVQRFVAPPVTHYLIVDRHDRARFTELTGPRTHIVELESLLPPWLRQVPGWTNCWWSMRTLPVRGWIVQQVAKLAVGAHASEDILVFVDSDVAFVRPWCPSTFVRGDRVRLYAARDPGSDLERLWLRSASKLLGAALDPVGDHVGNLISWRRDHALHLLEHIEKSTGRPWIEAVCRRWHLSEYLLYGVFVQTVLGPNAGHYLDDQRLCHEWWNPRPMSDDEMANFFSGIQAHQVAVMVSAKASMPPSRYRSHLAAIAAGRGVSP